jgi:hypothetical protein
MPQILRGQRVIELAQKKDCGWMADQNMPGSDAPASPPKN